MTSEERIVAPLDQDTGHDLGLFGPTSVTWRVHTEPILWLAGFRALLLQMTHPRALAGVVQNSNFREDPWGRLYRTGRFYGEIVFGDTATAHRNGARVRNIHARLGGVDPQTSEPFRVDDADLLRWIHVTATESFCSTAVRAGLDLTPAEIDQYYDEQRAVAELVGLDRGDVPASAAQTAEYYRSIQPTLRVDGTAREVARFLAVPTLPYGLGYTPVRPLWLGVAAFSFSLLPAWARRLYGVPALPTTDLAVTLGSRALRSFVRAVVPRDRLEGPLYKAAMARAAATG